MIGDLLTRAHTRYGLDMCSRDHSYLSIAVRDVRKDACVSDTETRNPVHPKLTIDDPVQTHIPSR